jgi:glutaredoxin 3
MRALRLLQTKGAEVEEYEISAGGPKREEMIQRANGRTTVPQIFIDGRHIGGCDDLMRLEYDGELDALLGSEPA